jgi:sterol desaturase/sphingolipid hydroxylase (fatty acid hydroxylase superfamily)
VQLDVRLLEWSAPLASAATLGTLWALEALAPMFAAAPSRAAHAGRNIAMGLINAAVRAVLFTGALLWVTEASRRTGVGLLHRVEWPVWATWGAAFVLLDGWGYAWHWLAHHTPALWRFHLVHHHDEHLDASTTLRFHFGEIVLQWLAGLAVLPLLGITMPELLLYELVLMPVALFHHANIRIPEWLDRPLRLVLVTPRMHWVHHSRWQPETDSNYSAVLSVWDRLFGTFRLRPDPGTLEIGLDGYSAEDSDTLRGMVATPFSPVRSGPGTPPVVRTGANAGAAEPGAVRDNAHRGTLGPCPPQTSH